MGLLPPLRMRLPVALLRATMLELAILAAHMIVYPSGLIPERRASRPTPTGAAPPGSSDSPDSPGSLESPGAAHGLPDTPDPAETHGSAAPPSLPARSPRHPPAVLLHGFVDNRSVFVLLRRSLARQDGRPVESLNYSPLTCDIRAAAELLGRHVEEICARTGRPRVDIVGHSLGGLIARYYVQRLGGDGRVRTLVTLGTPHTGTRVAPLASAHPIVRQMRPGSAVIEELGLPAPGCRTRFVSFWSDLDQIMVPLETARLEHPDLMVRNVRVSGIGHLALPVHPAVAAGIREALEMSGAEAESPGAVSVA
ncbi:esterase/lipase family protein [Streptomyces tirandamycinicus]|uniref:esterase/lipase family protein n=1 Tax=Streptomyces tirandamycinicus TaxID=2174846 RepID=UPI00227221B3|nr:alpha/beta fold hydrolase [Streptomyces tirandamycinicus]MCY0982684.1 alpha/beta fold hydrolase [Streptomyces tirandamycinicus]